MAKAEYDRWISGRSRDARNQKKLERRAKRDWEAHVRRQKERVSDILKIYDDRFGTIKKGYDDGLNQLKGVLGQRLSDIDRDAGDQSARASQDLISRGMFSSTMADSTQRRIGEARQRNRAYASAQFAPTLAEYERSKGESLSGVLGQRADFLERIDEVFDKGAVFESLKNQYLRNNSSGGFTDYLAQSGANSVLDASARTQAKRRLQVGG